MHETAEIFLIESEKKASDANHRKKLNFNISRYDQSVINGKKQYSDLELAKKRAAHIKNRSITNLAKQLIDFEARFTKNGGKVLWATDANEAVDKIIGILKKAKAKSVVKGKSMTTEEIHLNQNLEKNNIEPVETDLGEYIVQKAGEAPYHIVTPAMHKSKEDVAALFHEKEGLPAASTPQEITLHVRKVLREKFIAADAGITGVNFIIPEIGGIAITENEGNALMTMSFPKIHIAIAGIEKVIPRFSDLDLFWSLLSTYGTGQNITVYNTVLTGPRKEGETDGPEEMYVVLIDNGRTELLSNPGQRSALFCIRCGACLNGCPVYKNIGGHSYASTYSGPIGSVITPHYNGMKEYKHLSYASTLCGKCTEVCPVKIDLHKLLLYNRRDSVKHGMTTRSDNWAFYFWKGAMLSRSKMNKGGAKFRNFMIKQFFGKSWGKRRELPVIAPKSFNQLWKDKNSKGLS